MRKLTEINIKHETKLSPENYFKSLINNKENYTHKEVEWLINYVLNKEKKEYSLKTKINYSKNSNSSSNTIGKKKQRNKTIHL